MLLDWNMPNMTGPEVVEAVRAKKEWNKTRIIMATTEGSSRTMPRPRAYINVLAVPRSIDKSLENIPRKRFKNMSVWTFICVL